MIFPPVGGQHSRAIYQFAAFKEISEVVHTVIVERVAIKRRLTMFQNHIMAGLRHLGIAIIVSIVACEAQRIALCHLNMAKSFKTIGLFIEMGTVAIEVGTDMTEMDITVKDLCIVISELVVMKVIGMNQVDTFVLYLLTSGSTPYRGDHRVWLWELLGVEPDAQTAKASVEFIKAIVKQRNYKDEEEIRLIEESVDLSTEMHLAAYRTVRPGIHESEVAAAVEEVACRLLSLSTSDYRPLPALCDGLLEYCEPRSIGLSLPSLRADNFSMELMEKLQKVRKSGLTFAVEGGSQRLRDAINKNVTEEDLLKCPYAVECVNKWQYVHIIGYFEDNDMAPIKVGGVYTGVCFILP